MGCNEGVDEEDLVSVSPSNCRGLVCFAPGGVDVDVGRPAPDRREEVGGTGEEANEADGCCCCRGGDVGVAEL